MTMMLEGTTTERLDDAGAEFRRRLAQKLAARDYEGQALESKISEPFRKGVKMRLNIDEIIGT
jgi:hypothetical protein